VKALLLENVHHEAVRLLEGAGLEVIERRSALDEAELAAALPSVALLGIRSKTRLSAAVLAAAPDLIAVGAFCIGTDHTRSVVELTLAEIVALTDIGIDYPDAVVARPREMGPTVRLQVLS
jgi:D-3-phosphoglycerate dehydrogenase / 2-oxoglutarate reductase